jgi:cyanophycin synthetase
MTTTDGVYVDGTQLVAGDMAGPVSARMVLKNPRVDFAVLEAARGGILRSGLGFDRCNVAVVTNVGSDHLGLSQVDTLQDLARVKAVVPASVFRDGASVLNADNPWTVHMAREARGEIIFFSMDELNPVILEHVREQGRAVVLRQTTDGEMLSLIDHNQWTDVLVASDIPATAAGRIRVNVANALAATAAAIAAGTTIADVRTALTTFENSYAQAPGRFNLITIEGRQVLIDYGHNVEARAAVGDFVRRTAAPESVGVITAPGDRRDDDLRAFGELAAKTFDRIVIREDADPRARARGEVAAILHAAVNDAGLSDERISVVHDEVAAVHAGIDLAAPGALVVILVDRVPLVWQSLEARAGGTSPLTTDGSVSQSEPARLLALP